MAPPIPKLEAGLLALSFCAGCQRLDLQKPPPTGADEHSSTGSSEDGTDDGPVTFDCNPVVQDCDGGQKCTPIERDGGQNHYVCTSEDGSLGKFDRCVPDPSSGRDGCSPGLVCLDASDGEGFGVCVDLCGIDTDCTLGQCVIDPRTGVPYCGQTCDPLETECIAPLQCRHQDDEFVCRFPAEDEAVGEAGAPCVGEDFGCNEGYACVEGALFPGCTSLGCCTPLCDHTDPNTTRSCEEAFGTGVQCAPLLGSPPPGLERVGACYVPA